ncbi:MAG TPA: AI-2E family transporter [Ornithinibacter sp.]|nr:AI-2E family transporter [Ornithinibacter sp.]
MADAGRHAAAAVGQEPTATSAATTADVLPTATDDVAPGAVDAPADPVTAIAPGSPSSDPEVTDGSRRPGLPRLAMVVIVAGSLVLVLAGARETAGIIGPAFLALVLTITVHPVRRALVRRNVPEWLVAVAVVLSVYLLLFSVSIALLISAARLAELLPQYQDQFSGYTADVTNWLASLGITKDQAESVGSSIDPGSLVGVIGDAFSAVLAVLSNFFFILTVALMMAFDTGGVERVMAVVRTTRPHLVDALVSFAHGTRVYMGVAAGFGFIVAVIDGVALYVMGVPGAFIWAVLAFVTNFIPNIGFVIGVIPPAIIGLLEGGPTMMIGVIAVYSVINVVIQSVIQPRYVGDAVGLSPTITLLSLIFWAWALGAIGALLAVPFSLFMRAILIEADPSAHWVLPVLSGQLAKDEPDPPAPKEAPDAPVPA